MQRLEKRVLNRISPGDGGKLLLGALELDFFVYVLPQEEANPSRSSTQPRRRANGKFLCDHFEIMDV